MEDLTFLEDYQYQLKLNELERNLMAMERLGMEVADGLLAFHNATVVEQYQNKYGYTEHFKMLIGEEGIFESATDVLSSIITWLRKKLVQLASLIFNIVKGIADIFTTLVWAVFNWNKLKHTTCPYNLPKLKSTFEIVYSTVMNHVPSMFSPTISTIGDLTSCFNEWLDTEYSEFESKLDNECKQETDYSRIDFMVYAQKFQASLEDRFTVTLDTMGKAINMLQKSLNENDDVERSLGKLKDFEKRFPGFNNIAMMLSRTNLYGGVNLDNSKDRLRVFRTQASATIAIATSYSGFFNKCIRKGISIIKELHAAYNKGEASIHMEFPFDQSMIRRLSEFYGAPLTVTKLTVTNASPYTWNFATETPGLMGWCYGESGKSFPTELWVSARVIMSWAARFNAAFIVAGRVNKYDNFLSTVVHECKHLWDMQYGKQFDIQREGDGFFKYLKYQHEKRARDAANKFEITDSDRAWAKKIIDAVEAEVKKQQSAK